jgi:tripartite-type tricarboxylate transporter receptor subunit TctC
MPGSAEGLSAEPGVTASLAMSSPEVRERMSHSGMLPEESASPEELRRYVVSETARWADVVRSAGAVGIK